MSNYLREVLGAEKTFLNPNQPQGLVADTGPDLPGGDGANEGFWREQLRDRLGQFAKMFGMVLFDIEIEGLGRITGHGELVEIVRPQVGLVRIRNHPIFPDMDIEIPGENLEAIDALIKDADYERVTGKKLPNRSAPELRDEITGDEALKTIRSYVTKSLKEEGRFPVIRSDKDIEKVVSEQYKGFFDQIKQENPELLKVFSGLEIPDADLFWDYIKANYATDLMTRYLGPEQLPPLMRRVNQLYAEKFLGLKKDGLISFYRNNIRGKDTEADAAAGYASLDKYMAFDYNVASGLEDGGPNTGRYEIKAKPDEVNGLIGFSRIGDEIGVVLSPEVTSLEGRVNRLGDLEIPNPDTAPWLDLKNNTDWDRSTGGSPFRQHRALGQFDYYGLDKDPFGGGTGWSAFYEANGLEVGAIPQKYDELYGEGAWTRDWDDRKPMASLFKAFFTEYRDSDGTTKWGLKGDALWNIGMGETDLSNPKANDGFEKNIKILSTMQELMGKPFFVSRGHRQDDPRIPDSPVKEVAPKVPEVAKLTPEISVDSITGKVEDLLDLPFSEETLDNQTVKEIVDLLENTDYGKLKVRNVNIVKSEGYPDDVFINGDILDEDGNKVGYIFRRITKNKDGSYSIQHNSLNIKEESRGTGFGTKFSKLSEAIYKKLGISKIEITAADENGAYTWAKAGYDWNGSPSVVINSIRKILGQAQNYDPGQVEALKNILERFDNNKPGSPNYPTPKEIADLPIGKDVLNSDVEWEGVKRLDVEPKKEPVEVSAPDAVEELSVNRLTSADGSSEEFWDTDKTPGELKSEVATETAKSMLDNGISIEQLDALNRSLVSMYDTGTNDPYVSEWEGSAPFGQIMIVNGAIGFVPLAAALSRFSVTAGELKSMSSTGDFNLTMGDVKKILEKANSSEDALTEFKLYSELTDFERATMATSTLVTDWASSSNGNNARSLAIQEIAEIVFDTNNARDWKSSPQTKEKIEKIKQEYGDVLSAFLQAQYEQTQKRFKEAGITEVVLYRGIDDEALGKTLSDDKLTEVDVQSRPLSSWSTSDGHAYWFATGGYDSEATGIDAFDPEDDHKGAVLLRRVIPVEQILSSSFTGVGSYDEQEMVVVGGEMKAEAVGAVKEDNLVKVMRDREKSEWNPLTGLETSAEKKEIIQTGPKNWNKPIADFLAQISDDEENEEEQEEFTRGNKIQHWFIENAGFNDKPKVLSQEEFDALPGEPVYRALSSLDLVNDFINSETQYAGEGTFGNGTYTSNIKETTEYYAGYTNNDPDVIASRTIEMKLLPDANAVSFDDAVDMSNWAKNMLNDFINQYRASGMDPGQVHQAEWYLHNDSDWTNTAIMLGIDAIRFRVPLTDKDEYYTIILNRGKVAINGKSRIK